VPPFSTTPVDDELLAVRAGGDPEKFVILLSQATRHNQDRHVRNHSNPHAISRSVELFQRAIWFVLLAVFALLLYLWSLAPSERPFAPAAMLIFCGVLARACLRKVDDRIVLRTIVICGALAAIVFVPSILIEYFGRTVNNNAMFGTVALLCAVAGAVAAWRMERVLPAVCAATLSSLIASLAFVVTVLGSYCLLRGTTWQDRFFRTEGDYDDFARSGMSDFTTWIVGDLYGGVFFHLLLGAAVAALLGLAAGAASVSALRVRSRYSRPNTKSA
jgi:hypothetical protein